MTLCFFSFVTGSSHLFLGFLLFWIFLLFFGFWFFWLFPPPLFPLESSVFIRNVPGTPSTHGSFLDKHGWEGGVGFFAGTWIPEVRSLSPWVVIFMKIRFAICVLVGLGCRHSTIYFPSFQANSQRRKKKTKNSSYLTRWCFGLAWPFLNLVLEVSKFCIQASNILISNLNHLKIRLKSKWVKIGL